MDPEVIMKKQELNEKQSRAVRKRLNVSLNFFQELKVNQDRHMKLSAEDLYSNHKS